MTVFWDIVPCSLLETDRWVQMLNSSIIRAIVEAVNISETSVSFYHTTQGNIP
jgi:hypothetical protein